MLRVRMASISAGILMYRHTSAGTLVLLVHPGGPFWRNRDLGAEELGIEPTGPMRSLGQIRQRAGKTVIGFALEGILDVGSVRSNTVAIEWPPRTGRTIQVPEIDRAEWFNLPLAREKILPAQQPFLDRLEQLEPV
jgi:predicted NUDIX family NTP pyrophosphohydrolase